MGTFCLLGITIKNMLLWLWSSFINFISSFVCSSDASFTETAHSGLGYLLTGSGMVHIADRMECVCVCVLTALFLDFNPYFPAVMGGWSAWSAWSSCSVTCAQGFRSRQRTCTNPVPICEGICPGISTERETCNTQVVCPSRF